PAFFRATRWPARCWSACMRWLPLLVLAVSSCSPTKDDVVTSASGCGEDHALFYKTPGGGSATPAPVCWPTGPTDGCLFYVCTCDGKTIVARCDQGISQTPWSHLGDCGGADAGAD